MVQSISYNVCTESHVLLQDDERLKNERVRALKAKERFAQSTAGNLEIPFYAKSLLPMHMIKNPLHTVF